MKSLLLAILLSAQAFAGGSSSVGNGIYVDLPETMIDRLGDTFIDKKTGEKLIDVTPITETEIKKLGKQLIPAKLGRIEAREYTPKLNDSKGRNFWVVCDKQGKNCLKLTPVSRTNAKVPGIIGALAQ